ncbi:MAG: hypothetical protein Q4B40_06010 [Clostridia bacterium]|nr:hypothetical protein [Clostridia bacterium]
MKSIDKLKTNDKKILFRKIGEEFGIYGKYKNLDVSIEFEFTKRGIKESVNKQKNNYDIFVKMLSCFESVVNNAIGIEVHNRNSENYKTDITLKNCYVLVSAFVDDVMIYPVKLEIKEFVDKPNKLYLAITGDGIKKTRSLQKGLPIVMALPNLLARLS